MPKKVALHTLGCKLNFSETSTLGRQLRARGYDTTSLQDVADVYVINTCSVTENADKECRSLVRRIQRKNPDAEVIITGCYAQLQSERIAEIEGVSRVLGASEKFNLVQHVDSLLQSEETDAVHSCAVSELHDFVGSYSQDDRTRVFLKVQDGCDYPCTYCTIPMARGRSRSQSLDGVIQTVKEIAQSDAREIVLTGINLGDFGTLDGRRGEHQFLDLIQRLDTIEGIDRYRISSIEPNLLTDEIIDFVATSQRFMPHFHVPLQSGSDRILQLMKRRYRSQLYRDRIHRIADRMPHAGIGADVIVGFPTETEEDFQQTYDLLQSLPVSYLHVFTYSERPGTEALQLEPIVPVYVRRERNAILRELSEQKSSEFYSRYKNTNRPVLFESVSRDTLQGYTDNYIRVSAGAVPQWENEVVDWVL